MSQKRHERFSSPGLLEHLEHAVGDEEAAHDVGHGGGEGDRAEEDDHGRMVLAGDHDRAHHRDGGDRVGQRHERGVQQARDARDDAQADEGGEQEDEQEGGERGVRLAGPRAVEARSGSKSIVVLQFGPAGRRQGRTAGELGGF